MRTLYISSMGRTPSRTAEAEIPRQMACLRPALAAALLSVSAVLFSASGAASAAPADRIVQTSGGRPITADQVTSDNWDKVEYKKGSVSLNLDGIKVETVEYGDTPDEYKLALDKLAAGEHENAAALMKAAMASGARAWIKTYGPFQLGEIHRRWGAKDRKHYAEAVKQYDACLAANPKTRLRPQVIYGRAQAHLGAGDLDKGLADFDLLATEAYQNKYGLRWELTAAQDKARALDEGGRTRDARAEFQKLATTAKSLAGDTKHSEEDRTFAAEVAGLARLEQGRVLINDDKPSDAERFFSQIVDDQNEIAGVRAAALVGKGEALMAQKMYKEAQFAFATVRIQYFPADQARAEATYRLGLCAEALGAKEPKGSKLAQDYFLEVVQFHSASRWAQKAQEKLQ